MDFKKYFEENRTKVILIIIAAVLVIGVIQEIV
jgi:hypothetical protein